MKILSVHCFRRFNEGMLSPNLRISARWGVMLRVMTLVKLPVDNRAPVRTVPLIDVSWGGGRRGLWRWR